MWPTLLLCHVLTIDIHNTWIVKIALYCEEGHDDASGQLC